MSAISLTNTPSSTASSAPLAPPNYFKERRAEVKQLGEALKSGDLASAQQDYNSIVALGKSQLGKNNPFIESNRGLDFNAIGGALQNGDLAGAQQAFTDLQSTFGHKLPPEAAPSSAAPAAATTAANSINLIA